MLGDNNGKAGVKKTLGDSASSPRRKRLTCLDVPKVEDPSVRLLHRIQ